MLRRRWKIVILVCLLGALSGVATWWFMREAPPISAQIEAGAARSRKLLALAGRQAAKIAAVDIRLTRLLNLADQQIQRGHKTEARETLTFAGQTLSSKDAETLSDHVRISGWVSVSELSRAAGDKSAASAACDGAVIVLRAIDDPAKRCDYVIGLCNELQYLKGKAMAAQLLDEAGAWTRSIDSVSLRREAVTGFASALFNLDDYAAGERMIGREQDPSWGADTLMQLASMAQPSGTISYYAGAAPAARAPAMAAPMADVAGPGPGGSMRGGPAFGKEVNYRYVFQNQSRPQTEPAGR